MPQEANMSRGAWLLTEEITRVIGEHKKVGCALEYRLSPGSKYTNYSICYVILRFFH